MCQSNGVSQPTVTFAGGAIMFSSSRISNITAVTEGTEGLLALLVILEQLTDLHQRRKMLPQETLQITFIEDC